MEHQALQESQEYQKTTLTKASLEYADLVTLDLSIFDTPNGKKKLASQLGEATQGLGFFYLVNHGLESVEISQQFSLAASIFNLPREEKDRYLVDKLTPGLGYKPVGERQMAGGLKDNVEIYDDPKYNSLFKEFARPPPCSDQAKRTEKFCRELHNRVLRRLLILTANVLKLEDEEALWKLHNYEAKSDCHMRYMVQHPRDADEAAFLEDLQRRDRNVGGTVAGDEDIILRHTDFGTYTLLFDQPIAALQVKVLDRWKWIRPVPGSILVNVGETLSYMSNGYLKASTHRVVVPPADQRHIPRISVIYFTRPDDETPVQAFNSAVVALCEKKPPIPPGNPKTVGEWVHNIAWVIGYG